MKKIILFLIAVLFIPKIYAASVYFEQEDNDNYLKLCQYEVVNSSSYTDYIGVFYNMDYNNYVFVIKSYVLEATAYGKSKYTYKTTFSRTKTSDKIYDNKKGVYFQNSMAAGEFRCPKNGYIDYSDWSNNEICFDDDGQWCANYADDWTTKFGKTSEKFVSQKLVYNIEDKVKTYIVGNETNPDGWLFNDISCDDINSGKFNLGTDLKDKIVSDFSINFLKSRPAPEFIKNFDVYKKLNTINSSDGELDSDISIKIDNFKKKCIAEINEKLNSGELTSQEAAEAVNNYDVSNSDISSQLNAATTEIETGRGKYKIPWPEIKPTILTCEKLIGENMYKIVHFIITSLRIIGAIIAIVNGMISFIPALVAKDGEALKTAQKKCINMAIVLVLIILLPTLLTFIGNIFNYDLSCIV